jgi:hypothetical protein
LPDTSRYHDACGSPLDVRLWCPTCGVVVDDDHSDELEHL